MKTCKPLFGNKIKGKRQIALVEGNDLVSDDKGLDKTFNNFFANIVAIFGIKCEKLPSNCDDSNYNLHKLTIKYSDHPSILAIKNEWIELNSTFTFKKANKEQISFAVM